MTLLYITNESLYIHLKMLESDQMRTELEGEIGNHCLEKGMAVAEFPFLWLLA